MKLALFVILSALSIALHAQPIACHQVGPCVYIVPDDVTPAVQIDARLSPGYGLIALTADGAGIFASAQGKGIAIAASAIDGGTALHVSGSIVAPRTPRNILRVYDPDTGNLVGEFEFEFVQE